MTYSIIGSGAIGSALAGHFGSKGIPVSLANNRGPGSLADIVSKLGSTVKAVTVEEALSSDVVILAIPFEAIPGAVSSVSDWGGRIVVDATNAIDLPAFTPTNLGGRLSTEVVADAVPGARVVKAFNTIAAATLASNPAVAGGRRVTVISSDDADAIATVSALCEQLGFYPINLGRIADGGRLQQFGGSLTQNLIRID